MFERVPERVVELAQLGLLGAFGGAANYVYVTIQKEQKFSWWRMIVNMFLAFFVGNLGGELLPGSEYKDGILMAAGFCAYPILSVLEAQSKRWLLVVMDSCMTRVFGSQKQGKDDPEV